MAESDWILKFHRAILEVDIPKLIRLHGDPRTRATIRRQIDQALNEILEDPTRRGAPLKRPPLVGWRKYKFHSKRRPAPFSRPDMRVIYRVHGLEVQVLAVGRRLPGHPDDVYAVGESRPTGNPLQVPGRTPGIELRNADRGAERE